MRTIFSLLTLLMLGLSPAMAQDTDDDTDAAAEQPVDDAIPETADGAKMLTGMSILGNEETPKSLVIVPWKSSEMGDELSLSDTLDDRARPVDKEVFLRELRFYELRASE